MRCSPTRELYFGIPTGTMVSEKCNGCGYVRCGGHIGVVAWHDSGMMAALKHPRTLSNEGLGTLFGCYHGWGLSPYASSPSPCIGRETTPLSLPDAFRGVFTAG